MKPIRDVRLECPHCGDDIVYEYQLAGEEIKAVVRHVETGRISAFIKMNCLNPLCGKTIYATLSLIELSKSPPEVINLEELKLNMWSQKENYL